MSKLFKRIHTQAEELGCCEMFTGKEDLEHIIRLFLSPQGIEFCQNNNFPDIQTLRQFKQYNVERLGIFIDAGCIELKNVCRAVLIGDTQATINFDNNMRHEVIMMHGAKAEIKASGWAVVFITNKCGCEVISTANGRAKIL